MHLDCGFMDELRKHVMAEHHFQLQCSGDLLHGLCQLYSTNEKNLDLDLVKQEETVEANKF